MNSYRFLYQISHRELDPTRPPRVGTPPAWWPGIHSIGSWIAWDPLIVLALAMIPCPMFSPPQGPFDLTPCDYQKLDPDTAVTRCHKMANRIQQAKAAHIFVINQLFPEHVQMKCKTYVGCRALQIPCTAVQLRCKTHVGGLQSSCKWHVKLLWAAYPLLWAVEPRRVPVTLVVFDFAARWVCAQMQNLQLYIIWRVW